jgi:hypothetical protein
MSTTTELKLKFQKAYDFKTSFISGIHGGVSSNGLLTASLFTDRAAMPDLSVYTLNDKNEVIKMEDKKDSDVIREAQFAIIMDINTTKMLVDWLNGKIVELEKVVNKQNG